MSVLNRVTREAKPLPPRIVLYAAEKFGKTSWAAHSWQPIFLMTPGETGLLSLLETGRVPQVDHFPDDFRQWADFETAVRALRDDPHEYRTLVIDTGNGAEQLCAAAVCDDKFNGDWSEYLAYGRGNEQAMKKWGAFLGLLDDVRIRRRMAVILLQHAKVKTFQDPAGKDWDQWRPEAIDKLWGLTHKWADCILFGGFKVTVKQDKAVGESRYLRAEASSAIVAGNRYGLPPEITAAPGAANLWKAFADHLGAAKKRGQQPQQAPKPAPVQAPAPAAAPEGEQRADFTPAAKSATPPSTAAPTTATPTPAPSAAATPAPAKSSEPAPRPAPAAERRTAPPPIPPHPAQYVLSQLQAVGTSWPEVRDCRGEGEAISYGAGLGKLPPSTRITDLTPEQLKGLLDVVEPIVSEKRRRAANRAKSKAERERELALEMESAS